MTGRLEAEEEQNPDGWTASIQVTVRDEAAAPIITGVQTPKDITVDYGTAFADLPLPERVTVSLSDGGTDTVAVVWSEEGYDAKTPGDYVLTGRLEAGEGQNPDGWIVNIRVTVGDRPADNPSLALAQKEAAEILAAYEGNNDTSAQDILSAVQNGLRNADISVEWDRPFALQKATADGDGRITGSLLLSLNGETATVTLDMAIPRLENGVDPDQSDPEAPSTSDDQPSGPAGSDGAADESATTPAGQPPRTGDTPFAAALSIALCAVGMLGLVAAAGLRSRTRSGRR